MPAKFKKTTHKPVSYQEFVLRPIRWRMALIYAGFFALAVFAGMLIRLATNSGQEAFSELFNDWYINLAIVVGGAIIFALLDYPRWTIRVVGMDRIEGSTGAFGERVALPLKDMDWPRSRKSLNSRMKVGNAMYTVTGKRILISPWFYDARHFQEFLDRIGYRPG